MTNKKYTSRSALPAQYLMTEDEVEQRLREIDESWEEYEDAMEPPGMLDGIVDMNLVSPTVKVMVPSKLLRYDRHGIEEAYLLFSETAPGNWLIHQVGYPGDVIFRLWYENDIDVGFVEVTEVDAPLSLSRPPAEVWAVEVDLEPTRGAYAKRNVGFDVVDSERESSE